MGYSEQEIYIMNKCLELSDTVEQGLEYIQEHISKGQYEQGANMLSNIIDGFLAIDRSLNTLENVLVDKPSMIDQESMTRALESMGEAASNKKWVECTSLLSEQLFPTFKVWHQSLHQSFDEAVSS